MNEYIYNMVKKHFPAVYERILIEGASGGRNKVYKFLPILSKKSYNDPQPPAVLH